MTLGAEPAVEAPQEQLPGTPNRIEIDTGSPRGQIKFERHDRKMAVHEISEPELRTLEMGSENQDRTWGGVAFGSALAIGLVLLSSYHHLPPTVRGALWTGLIGSVLMLAYFGQRARTARTNVRQTISDVRKRDGVGQIASPIPAAPLTLRAHCTVWWRERNERRTTARSRRAAAQR